MGDLTCEIVHPNLRMRSLHGTVGFGMSLCVLVTGHNIQHAQVGSRFQSIGNWLQGRTSIVEGRDGQQAIYASTARKQTEKGRGTDEMQPLQSGPCDLPLLTRSLL